MRKSEPLSVVTPAKQWRCGRFCLDLTRPKIMGIVNVTPDSFSDGGQCFTVANALHHAEKLLAAGAHILDIGGESTRPNAVQVGLQEELDRVLPVLEGLRSYGVPLSIDTRKPAVMRAAIAIGVDIVNDIGALEAEGALAAMLDSTVGVCLMHKQGEPTTMQVAPSYADVCAEVEAYLLSRAAYASEAGVAFERIVLDVGFGFGKSFAHNQALFQALPRFCALPYPMLVGVSRKAMLGEMTGRPVAMRQAASVAAALLAVQAGASIVRVHDVAETADALAVWQALAV